MVIRRQPWFNNSINGTIRVFGECYPNNMWFKQSKNGSTLLMGLGAAILQVSVIHSWLINSTNYRK